MMAPENASRIPADLRASICKLRVLCVGNGGMIGRGGRLWSHRFNGAFLAEMGGLVKEIVFCNWLDNGDDPLCQTDLGAMSGVRPLGLPPITGGFLRKGINGLRALAILTRELARTHFVYLYWPGRLPWIVSGLCRALHGGRCRTAFPPLDIGERRSREGGRASTNKQNASWPTPASGCPTHAGH